VTWTAFLYYHTLFKSALSTTNIIYDQMKSDDYYVRLSGKYCYVLVWSFLSDATMQMSWLFPVIRVAYQQWNALSDIVIASNNVDGWESF
jgi:hypothetical protein